jgi:cysteine desulfurase
MSPMRRIYLDHNASSPLRPQARAAMLAALDNDGNPSSVHSEGRQARAIVEDAREHVAALVGAEAAEVVFTSGATEAANAVVNAGYQVILLARIEHPCIIAPAEACGAALIDLPVTSDGIIDRSALAAALERIDPAKGRALVCLQVANNETGVIQPVAEMAALARARGADVFADAVQAAGRISLDMRELGADAIILSAHKLGGPKGAGAIVGRSGWRSKSFVKGGGQERRRRGGTENVAAIAGFGAAASALRETARSEAARIEGLRDRLEREVVDATPEVIIVGHGSARLPNTACIALPHRLAETVVIKLDLAGIAISAGAACSSGKVGVSATLAAMGLNAPDLHAAVRISLGWNTSDADITAFSEVWRAMHGQSIAARRVA